MARKTISVTETIKNEAAEAASRLKSEIVESRDILRSFKQERESIDSDLKNTKDRIKNISEKGSVWKSTKKELSRAEGILERVMARDVTKGVVNEFNRTDDYFRLKTLRKRLSGYKKDLENGISENRKAEGFKNSKIYQNYQKKKQKLREYEKEATRKKLYGQGIHKKSEIISKKSRMLDDEIRRRMNPDIESILSSEGYNHSALSDKSSKLASQISSLEADRNHRLDMAFRLEDEKDELTKKRYDNIRELSNLAREHADQSDNLYNLKKQQVDYTGEAISFNETIFVFESNGIIKKRNSEIKIQQSNKNQDMLSKANAELREALEDWLRGASPSAPSIYEAYIHSHKIVYDSLKDEFMYYDPSGEGWGTFSNNQINVSYYIKYPLNGNNLVTIPVSSYGIITMAERGRLPFTIHPGAYSRTNCIQIIFGDGRMVKVFKNVEVPEYDKVKIGIKSAVERIVTENVNKINREYFEIKNKIRDVESKISDIDDKINNIANGDLEKYTETMERRISSLQKDINVERNAYDSINIELDKKYAEQKTIAGAIGIVDLIGEKEKYDKRAEKIARTKEKIKTERTKLSEEWSGLLDKYKAKREKYLLDRAMRGKAEIENSSELLELQEAEATAKEKYEAKIEENRVKRDARISELNDRINTYRADLQAMKIELEELKQTKDDLVRRKRNLTGKIKYHLEKVKLLLEDYKEAKHKYDLAKSRARREATKKVIKKTKDYIGDKVDGAVNTIKNAAKSIADKVGRLFKKLF